MNKYYKVVQRVDNRLCSYNMNKEGPGRLDYKIGEWTKPIIENSKLFVFDTYKNVINFLTYSSCNYSIFVCEVKNPIPFSIIACVSHNKEIIDFWNRRDTKNRKDIDMMAPFGTIACDEVKLLYEVIDEQVEIC